VDSRRLLEIPQWMFDASVVCLVRFASSPVACAEALRELKELIDRQGAVGGGEVLQAQHQGLSHTAQKQFDATDPENRLVADELECRWNQALQQVQAVQVQLDEHVQRQERIAAPNREDFLKLATELETLWPDAVPDYASASCAR
jgi:hypothetical protein